jgi:hypothetical protein
LITCFFLEDVRITNDLPETCRHLHSLVRGKAGMSDRNRDRQAAVVGLSFLHDRQFGAAHLLDVILDFCGRFDGVGLRRRDNHGPGFAVLHEGQVGGIQRGTAERCHQPNDPRLDHY